MHSKYTWLKNTMENLKGFKDKKNKNTTTIIILILIYIYISTAKRLIAINHIQNKSFCLHNMCVLCIFIMYIEIHTHMHVYI